jgi:hypothetical protein
MGLTSNQSNFLLELSNIKTAEFDGRFVIINFRDSLRQGLVSVQQSLSLVSRCTNFWNHQSIVSTADRLDAGMVFQQVCKGLDDRAGKAFVRLCQQKSNDGVEWTTVVGYSTFEKHLVNQDVLRNLKLAPLPSGDHPQHLTIQKVKRAVDDVVKHNAWKSPSTNSYGAYLAIPQSGENCWISSQHLDMVLNTKNQDVGSEVAWQVRRALGLPAKLRDDQWALRFRFKTTVARALVNDQVARPIFLDNGTNWFRVRAIGPSDKRYAAYGWGHTQHITPSLMPSGAGRPERVVEPLPIQGLTGLQIDVLGPGDPQNISSQHADMTLNDLLVQQLAGQSIAQILDEINQYLLGNETAHDHNRAT